MNRTQNRIVRRYKELLPIDTPITEEDKERLRYEAPLKPTLITHKEDKCRAALLWTVLQANRLLNIKVMSLYDVVDQYLDEDKPPLLDISPEVLMVYGGYHEAPNKQLENLNLQVWENLRHHNKPVVLYWMGTIESLKTKYPEIHNYTVTRHFRVVDLNKTNKSVIEEVDEL